MTAVLYDEVVTTAPAPRLTAAPKLTVAPAPKEAAPKKASRRIDSDPFGGGDPLVTGAARLLSIPLRHLYAALWRVGVLEVGA
ncbi:Rv1535 family protein [Mycobacterium xenopi]|uniref:Uncharacterized protein n=1 Tax=Mycobacterium xenopi TaxID=1789 RepID=A0AAD1H0T1_MYCXE|nr:Rv1535 family protein [Mycobacterium xenopi]EID15115.1 hypothetical protein MXEN_07486 [Mycobacterium xenopi RIVM700367]MDA3637978.1 Rv1535 family protein [Mycobacterium xenopi]MDA3656047.1 Rv1535 family protein [Mycobacterium xenopi]MDA3660634.1 Rv1535 family protein [Mycobacterium xenopi]ORX09421.1 hypothetical protein AWC32_18725 [Mycobacterium xenopi]